MASSRMGTPAPPDWAANKLMSATRYYSPTQSLQILNRKDFR